MRIGNEGSVAELRPCLRNGASWRAGVGRVRSLACLSILRLLGPQFHMEDFNVLCRNRVFRQPANLYFDVKDIPHGG